MIKIAHAIKSKLTQINNFNSTTKLISKPYTGLHACSTPAKHSFNRHTNYQVSYSLPINNLLTNYSTQCSSPSKSPSNPTTFSKFLSSLALFPGILLSTAPSTSLPLNNANNSALQGQSDQEIAEFLARQPFDPNEDLDPTGQLALDALSPAIKALAQYLQEFHSIVGVSWPATIVILAIIIRLSMLPITYYQNVVTARRKFLAPTTNKVKLLLRNSSNISPNEKNAFLHDFSNGLCREHECNQLRSLLSAIIQAPIFACMGLALRSLMNTKALISPDFEASSFLWMDKLGAIDSTLILPLILSAANYSHPYFQEWVTKWHTTSSAGEATNQEKDKHRGKSLGMAISQDKHFVPGVISLLFFPLMCTFPSGLLIYTAAILVIQFIQTAAFAAAPAQKHLINRVARSKKRLMELYRASSLKPLSEIPPALMGEKANKVLQSIAAKEARAVNLFQSTSSSKLKK
jgi:membrane protein insertase Oxa1/YidC/SpoIIIJ